MAIQIEGLCPLLQVFDMPRSIAFYRDVQPPVVRDYGMRQLGLSDPDGYGICLQWPAA